MIFNDLPKLDFVDKTAELLKDNNIDHKPLRWVDAAWLRDRFLNILLHLNYWVQWYDIKEWISWHPTRNFEYVVGNRYNDLLFENEENSTDGICTTDPWAGLVDTFFPDYHRYEIPNELRVQLPPNPIDIDYTQTLGQITDDDIRHFREIEDTLSQDFWVTTFMAYMWSNPEWAHSKYGQIDDPQDRAGYYADWYQTFDAEGKEIWVGHTSQITGGLLHSFTYEDVKDMATKGIDGGFAMYVPVYGYERRTKKRSDGSWDDHIIYGSVLKRLDLVWNNSTCRFEVSIGQYRQMILDAANDMGINLLQTLPGPTNERVYQWIETDNGLDPLGNVVVHLKSSD